MLEIVKTVLSKEISEQEFYVFSSKNTNFLFSQKQSGRCNRAMQKLHKAVVTNNFIILKASCMFV